MATKTQSRSSVGLKVGAPKSRSLKKVKTVKAASKPKSRSSVKAAAKPASKKAPASAPSRASVAPKASVATRKGTSTVSRGGASSAPGHLKLLTQVFGPGFPTNKMLNADGAAVAPSIDQLQILQIQPSPDRMSWIYVTHGLSLVPAAKHNKPFHLELAAHWKTRDPKAAARILAAVTKQILDSGLRLNPGDIVASDETTDLRVDGCQHWMVCPVDKAIPPHVKTPGGNLQFLVLLGITEDELQMALKVRPETANGRQVLLEALRIGGVFPVSDPARGCMTRRRDFHRIWENAFHAVKDRVQPV